ncbi:MAG: hypothetical protein FWE49_02100 [Synergistaceae bacterium]|nr:hypothetical protein [Synergistaceae bacterium]
MQVDEAAILDLASSELEFFRSLKKLIKLSADLINSENMEELMVVLEEKQTMISRYEIILEEWNSIGLSLDIKDGRDNPDFWVILFQALQDDQSKNDVFSVKLRSLFEQIKTLAEESVNIEDNSQEVLNEYVKRLRTRISQVSKGRNACKGYASASGGSISSR